VKSSIKVVSVLLLLSNALPVLGSNLNDGIAETISPNEQILEPPFYEILVVSADKINSGPHLNRNPPRGVFTLHEVLRGYVREKKVELQWTPPDGPEDRIKSLAGQNWYRQPYVKRWYNRALPAPSIGKKIIVFAVEQHLPTSQLLLFDVRGAYQFTGNNRKTILQNMGPTDRNPTAQGMLGLTVVALVVLSVSRLEYAFRGSTRKRLRALIQGGLACAASILVYIYYEHGNVIGSTFGFDLWLLYPVMLFNVAVVLSALGWLGIGLVKRNLFLTRHN